MYWINNLPDTLPKGEYDVTMDNARYVTCRDGSCELVIETTFRGARDDTNPTLLHFTKD